MSVFLMDCPRCPATNSSFTVVWCNRVGNEWRVCATCGACNDVVVANLTGPNQPNPAAFNGDITKIGFRFEQSWPARALPVAPPFTPEPSAARFKDGEFNYQNGRWNAAVAMYRATLDLATKDLQAVGSSFYNRLKWLADNGRVTAQIRDWGDHVRIEGNSALHDPNEFSETDAKALRYFTEMFLRYVFEMPGEVRRFRHEIEPEATNLELTTHAPGVES